MRFLDRRGRTREYPPSQGSPYRGTSKWTDDENTIYLTIRLRALDLTHSADVIREAAVIAYNFEAEWSASEDDETRHGVLIAGAVVGLSVARAEEATGIAIPGYFHKMALNALREVERQTPSMLPWAKTPGGTAGSSEWQLRHEELTRKVAPFRSLGTLAADSGYWLGRVGLRRMPYLLNWLAGASEPYMGDYGELKFPPAT